MGTFLRTLLAFYFKLFCFSAVIFRWVFLGRRPQRRSFTHISELPNEMLLLVFRDLPVIDRLRCERVNHRWKGLMSRHGWNADKKLDKDFVFGGAGERQIGRFNQQSLIALFRRFGPVLIELDLGSFGRQLQSSLPEISESLHLLRKVEKLNIEDLELQLFLDALPSTLRGLRTNGPFSDQALDKIAEKCPSLNSIRFSNIENVSLLKLSAFFDNYPRLQTLHLRLSNAFLSSFTSNNEVRLELYPLGELEELIFTPCTFNAQTLYGFIEEYKRLRNFELSTLYLSSEELLKLAEMPCLEQLTVRDMADKFTDPVLMAIARRGQLKELSVTSSNIAEGLLTDTSIFYLIDKCKSIVSLSFDGCLGISERSVESVVAEVRRRHGNRLLPTGPSDPRILTIKHRNTGINGEKAREMTENNPWIRFSAI